MSDEKLIYLAGGCFWGLEKYLSEIKGVLETEAGYANGNTKNPSYKEVCTDTTGFAETVKIKYDPHIVSLPFILQLYYDAIDPTSLNRQGGDTGTQYRTGVYYVDEADKEVIGQSIKTLQLKYTQPIVIEVMPLFSYYPAEEYHQKYLDKNPGGYCHIDKSMFQKAKEANEYKPKTRQELKQILTQTQYDVTQNNATEQPFENEYYDNFKEGIYVDVTTGQPLFVSTDKFESGCGWPSFSKPISHDLILSLTDNSHGMNRTEVRSKTGNTHLGHVFNDGPVQLGGLRYCINSAALKFIPKDEMISAGYGHLLPLLQKSN